MKRRPILGTITVLVYLFVLAPIPVIIWMSLFKASYMAFPPQQGYSFQWYFNLGQQVQLVNAFVISLELAAVSAVLSTVIGFLGALALHRARVPMKGLLVNAFVMPLAVPSIISGLALYLYLYNLQSFSHLRMVPTLAALVAAHVVVTLPWTFRFTYAGLAGQGTQVERASLDLGRTPIGTLWHVTLPLARQSLVGAAILAFVFSFGDLEMSLFLVGPGQLTLPVAMVQYAQFKVDPTIAAMSVVQVAIIGIILLVSDRFVHFGRVFAGGTKQ